MIDQDGDCVQIVYRCRNPHEIMASLIERKGIFYAQFFNTSRIPKSKRFSLKTSDRRVARRRLVKWEEDAAYDKFDPWLDDPWTYAQKEDITLCAAFDKFIVAKCRADLSPATIKLYEYDLSPLLAQVGRDTLLKCLSPLQIDAYVVPDRKPSKMFIHNMLEAHF